MTKHDEIIACTVPLLARHGYAGTGMRTVAEAAGVQPSVIYHYFPNKEDLLRDVRTYLNHTLDEAFDQAPAVASAGELLRQRLELNFVHMEAVVALLQYFLWSKPVFVRLEDGGYVPARAYRHMSEIIERGVAEGSYVSERPDFDAKIMAHLVNGFLLEFYPHTIAKDQLSEMVEQMARFIERSLMREAA